LEFNLRKFQALHVVNSGSTNIAHTTSASDQYNKNDNCHNNSSGNNDIEGILSDNFDVNTDE
jgi:hypothetical protein